MQMTGVVTSVEAAYTKSGKNVGSKYIKATINGKVFNVFDTEIEGAVGKLIEYEVIQNGQYENFGKQWAYAAEGTALPPQPAVVSNDTGLSREDSILRQSSLKAGIEVARLVMEADKLPVAVKKDPALVEQYVKDLTVRLFHWVKAGNWDQAEVDVVMEDK